MEIYNLDHEVRVFGSRVGQFPDGIGEAFGKLMSTISHGSERSYYGISYMTADGKIIYFTTAEELQPGEAEIYHYERMSIQKGEYLVSRLHDWKKKTACIKDIFAEMMKDSRADQSNPLVEWYKTEEEMLCMVKAKVPVGKFE